MRITMEFTGFEEMAQTLKMLPGDAAKKLARTPLIDASAPLERALLSTIPRITGTLSQSVSVSVPVATKTSIAIDAGPREGWFTGPAFYAGMVEWGHKIRSRKFRRQHRNTMSAAALEAAVPPHPYVSEAFNQAKAAMTSIFLKGFFENVAKYWKRPIRRGKA